MSRPLRIEFPGTWYHVMSSGGWGESPFSGDRSTALHPEEVRYSMSDRTVKLFYRFYPNTKVGNKWLCVVAKYLDDDAFVITAYLTDKFKRGDLIWPNP
jgi:hypothetical protein